MNFAARSKFLLKIIILSASFLFLGSLFIFRNQTESVPSEKKTQIQIKGVKIDVELAILPNKQARGLGGRNNLPGNQGMLFLYDTPAIYSFWMKDMEFPIDIVWIDENYRIVDITKNISPDTFPQSFQPLKPVQYVLEVNAGFADRNNLIVNDVIDFSSTSPVQKVTEFLF